MTLPLSICCLVSVETGKCGTVDLETLDEAPKELLSDGRRGSTVRADVILEEGSESDPSSEASSSSETNLPVCVFFWLDTGWRYIYSHFLFCALSLAPDI